MDPKAFHRKLAAILSADVAGYSRLMQDDEAATFATVEACKQIFSDLIKLGTAAAESDRRGILF
ncbi:MAG: hypothetical protein MZV49_12825 [Rhodopseudomonas palustris]|nr:hypothetical protein [Rhodopseudomonas palustris]